MREILFRGKSLDNGELVEGFFHYTNWYDPHTFEMVDTDYWILPIGGQDAIQVDPETVGQYTGLKDKNGKRIFEGDMLKPFDDDIDKMVVIENTGSFLLCLYGDRGYRSESGDWEFDGSNYGVIECEPLSSYGNDIEIIGTIYDKSELPKEGGK